MPLPASPAIVPPQTSLPKKPSKHGGNADAVLVLFQKNVEKIRLWYKKQPGSGQELGHHTMLELVFGDFSVALEMAIQGKEWEPV